MKKLLTLTGIASIGAVLALLAACQTTGTGDVIAQKEALLTQSGFKVITVTTPSAATGSEWTNSGQGHSREIQREKRIYVFPTGTKDKIYVRDTKSNSTPINTRSRRRMPAIQRPRRRLSKVRRRWQDSL